MRNSEEKRLQRVVAPVCATLFAVFTFLFVAVYQAPLLEAFYNEVATGKLAYNPWLVGGVVSLLLTVLALWLNRFAQLRREWTALAYLPSALLLAFITDIDRGIYSGGSFSSSWVLIFVSGIFLYCFVAFVLRKILFEKIKDVTMVTNRVLWRNMILFVLLICLVGTLSNGNGDFKREALVMSHFNRGDTVKALRVGKTSLESSCELTAIRAYVLASAGAMGERLFEYPQLFGPEGLLPGIERTSPLVQDSVYSLIGAVPDGGEKTVPYLSRVAHTDSATSAAKEYYLAALLLDKQLVKFKDEIVTFYGINAVDSLPKHYREALMLYVDIAGTSEFEFKDTAMRAKLDGLRAEEAKHNDAYIRGNYVRRKYGKTYWWYFLYSN